jgi:2'-5' RNA ligase
MGTVTQHAAKSVLRRKQNGNEKAVTNDGSYSNSARNFVRDVVVRKQSRVIHRIDARTRIERVGFWLVACPRETCVSQPRESFYPYNERMANESAIIVPVGEAEPIVAPLRLQHDKSARLGVPAHITLLYPFLPPHFAESETENLTKLFSAIPAFEFSLIEVRRFPQTAYLHPNEPQRFTEIVRKLLERWPDCRPYNGAYSDIIPHLTVADCADAQTLDMVQEYLLKHLPIACLGKEAWLLFSNDIGFWSRKACFRLGTFQGVRSHETR